MSKNNIGIIIQREFNERVRKRAFIISTLLTPLLFVGIMVAPMLMSKVKSSTKEILVVDNSGFVGGGMEDTQTLKFKPSDSNYEQIKLDRASGDLKDLYGVLVIGADILENSHDVQLYAYGPSTLDIENAITRQIEGVVELEKMKSYPIDDLPKILEEVKTTITMSAYSVDEDGKDKQSASRVAMITSLVFGMLIYMFVFLYGGMVMQGVIEEKSSKIIEVIISSVKPFQLMMGKILGIALVALTQFFIWVALITILGSVAMMFFRGDPAALAAASGDMGAMAPGVELGDSSQLASTLKMLTDPAFLIRILGGFIVFFIGGYLLYAAMFAAIGSAVDDAADTQQLQVPVTIPMIVALLMMMSVMRDPNSSLAFWGSMIPLTSPIVMMARLPYGVPTWELVLSIVLLYASFVAMVWLAGKIYRVGIFMTGKKPTLKEVIKWSRYKY